MLNGSSSGTEIKGVNRARRGGRPLRAFTLIELLVVIAIIGILAAMVLGVGNAATKWKKRSRVQAELAQLVTAIDSYHKKLGNYPPDNPSNPAVNQLYYELTGVVYTNFPPPVPLYYSTVDGSSSLQFSPVNTVKTTFNQDGFLNAQEVKGPQDLKDLKPFLELKSADQKEEIRLGSLTVFLLAVPVRGNPTNELVGINNNGSVKVNPWRYVLPGSHNPKSYDLWAEVQIGDTTEIIGNWNSNK